MDLPTATTVVAEIGDLHRLAMIIGGQGKAYNRRVPPSMSEGRRFLVGRHGELVTASGNGRDGARPHFDDPMVTLKTFSFPSGHTAGAVAFYGVLAAFLVSRYYGRGPRAASVGLAIIAVVLVAFSRMYLGAHYPSDVVAATCSSLAWLALCLSVGHALVRRKTPYNRSSFRRRRPS